MVISMHVIVYGFILYCFFFFKQKTAYELRISDWSSDVCSSDLAFELIGDFGWRISGYNNIPARAVDFVRQSQGHGLSRHCLWQVPVESDDGFDRAGLA